MRRWLIRLVVLLSALCVLAIVAYIGVYIAAEARFSRQYPLTHERLDIPEGTAVLERGRHVVEVVSGCAECHGADLGGKVMIENFPFGHLVAPNLTRGQGGKGASYKDEDWIRAIRHGVSPEGRPLVIMPSDLLNKLSTDDLVAAIAYVRQAPPVDRDLGPSKIGPLARILFVTGKAPLLAAEHIDHAAAPGAAPAVAATAEYGRYLGEAAGCVHCHGATLQGGPMPGAPPDMPVPPRIARLGSTGWSTSDFRTAMRQGRRPDGRALREPMPWRAFAGMTDVELDALWSFINGPLAPADKAALLQ